MKKDDPILKGIIKRYVDDIYTKEDVDAFFGSDLRENLMALEDGMDESRENSAFVPASAFDIEKYKAEAQRLLNRHKRKRLKNSLMSFGRYAAVIAVLLVAGFGWLLYVAGGSEQERLVHFTEVYVGKGERESLVLPDGTSVTLNSDTYLRYPSRFHGDTRTIEVNGEAFLHVAPDKSKPFVVRTERIDVKVLGTTFNVKAYKDDRHVIVSVEEGKVKVDMPEVSMNLSPDEMMILDKNNGEMEKRNVDSRKTASWTNGGLYFHKTSVEDVAKELERCYNCTIRIENEELRKEVVYGSHSNESLESVLNALEYVVDVKSRKEGSQIILYR